MVGLRAPSRSTTIRSVPVRRATTWSASPIRSTMSMAGAKRSTACPPVLRRAGARSTTVTRKPLRRSQYAVTGPAMLAPEIRTSIPVSLLTDR